MKRHRVCGAQRFKGLYFLHLQGSRILRTLVGFRTGWMVDSSTSNGEKDCHTSPHKPPVQWISFPAVNLLGPGNDHPLPASTKVKLGYSYTSTSPLCPSGMWSGDFFLPFYMLEDWETITTKCPEVPPSTVISQRSWCCETFRTHKYVIKQCLWERLLSWLALTDVHFQNALLFIAN